MECRKLLHAVSALRRCTKIYEDVCSKMLKEKGMNLLHLEVIECIFDCPGISPMALSKKVKVTPASMTYILDAFEARAWLVRKAVDTDKRSFGIHLTDLGTQELSSLMADAQEWNNALEGIVGEREQADLHRGMDQLGLLEQS